MPKELKITSYSRKELYTAYNVSWKTFKIWLLKISDLGDCEGKRFTPKQVEKIINHLGQPTD